jgi:K+-sensing histidine kinase KdpD
MKRYQVPQGVQAQDLIAMTVHDLRTPVTAIKGFGQLALRQHDLPPAARQHLDMVVGEANRITALIDDLVLLSRLEHGDEAARPTKVDLAELLADVVHEAPRQGLGGLCVLARELHPAAAWCDPVLVHRAIANLIRYALKFGSQSAPVALAAWPTATGATVTVSTDRAQPNGHSGILAPVERENTREPVADVLGEVQPRGLGMYIAARLIEIQRGQLWINTLASGGVQLSVVLSHDGRDAPSTKGGSQQWS